MITYEDLTERDYFDNISVNCTTVGWLESGKPYSTSRSPNGIVEKIYEFSKMPGMYQQWCGYHECDFCEFSNVELGAKTISIAYKNKMYFCSALIAHYIEKHHYLPPSEFIEAVLHYNHQFAMKYFKEIKENSLPKIK